MGTKKEIQKNDINLFWALREQTKQDAERRDIINTNIKIALIILIPTLFMMVWGGLALYQENETDQRIQSVRAYVENRDFRTRYVKRNFIRSNMNRLAAYNEACGGYLGDLRKADRITQERFRQIEAQLPPDVTLTGYEFTADTLEPENSASDSSETAARAEESSVPRTSGTIKVIGDTMNKDGPSQFAGQLVECNLFKKVEYDGFSSSAGEQGPLYHFTIVCTLW